MFVLSSPLRRMRSTWWRRPAGAATTACRAAAAMALTFTVPALAADAAGAPEAPGTAWIAPGFWSHHFDRHAGYREDNVGLGVEWDRSPEWFGQAGSYINSDRARTRYAGAAWLPLERWGIRLGLYGGAFDGYPKYRQGGWFVAGFPLLSYRGERFGANLTVIPSYQDRLHGAIVGQLLLRVW